MTHPILAYNICKQICKQASLPAGVPPCSSCSFILGTEKAPFGGGENIVFALQDHNGREICMRIQREFTKLTSYVLNSEVNFRKAIESFGISGFQKVIGYSLEGNDLIHAPFIMLEWVHGVTLRWTDDFPIDVNDRNKIIRAVAKVTIDLLKIQQHGKYSLSGPCLNTSLTYLQVPQQKTMSEQESIAR
jgi:hypothetical protein